MTALHVVAHVVDLGYLSLCYVREVQISLHITVTEVKANVAHIQLKSNIY